MNDQQPAYKPPVLNEESVAMHSVGAKGANIKVPLILMVWPVIAFVGVILLYAVIGYLAGQFSQVPTSEGNDELFGNQSTLRTVSNVVLFLIGSLSVTIGPISFITGLVLMIVRLNEKNKKTTV